MFRAFLHLENKQKNKTINICEKHCINDIESVNEYLQEKNNDGFELIDVKNIDSYTGIYFFKKTEVEEIEMSIEDFINYDIMLDEVLKILHAPYLTKNE